MNPGYTLDNNEKVIRSVHRHWIDLMPVAVSTTVMILVVVALSYLYGRYRDVVPVPPSVVVLIMALLVGLGVLVFLLGIFIYRQNCLILTNLHLIQIEQRGLFNRQVSQLSLARVQDVSGRRVGMLATMLNFGNVEVQSAGEQDKFIFRNAPSPQELADQCLVAHEQFVRDNPTREL